MRTLQTSLRWGKGAPVTGEVVWCCSQLARQTKSNVLWLHGYAMARSVMAQRQIVQGSTCLCESGEAVGRVSVAMGCCADEWR